MSTDDPLLSQLDDRIDAQRRHPAEPPPAPGGRAPAPPTAGAANWGRRTPSTPTQREHRAAPAVAPQDDGGAFSTSALVHYLDAELELSRRRTDEGFDRVLEALATIDARLAAFDHMRDELFSWLDSYVTWEAKALTELYDRLDATGSSPSGAPAAAPPT